MILILGGTTEGRTAARLIDEAGKPFYYSTKRNEQAISFHNGIRISGGLDEKSMVAFCRENAIRLLVDASHPFASVLHKTVIDTSRKLNIPAIRFDRIYPENLPDGINWCNDYDSAIVALQTNGIRRLLALTGVQSVSHLKTYWEKHECFIRILERESSLQMVRLEGFPEDHLIFYHTQDEIHSVLQQIQPEAILLKEDGFTGQFDQKVSAALREGIEVYAIRRPEIPDEYQRYIDGENGLRRAIERILPEYFDQRSGLTTGSCAAAAAGAAVEALFFGNAGCRTTTSLRLPNGETIYDIPLSKIEVHTGKDGLPESATATVIKDGGDDPDVTDGLPVIVTIKKAIEKVPCSSTNDFILSGPDFPILIRGGKGIGIVSLPGLGIEVGYPAINAVPRKMIACNIRRIINKLLSGEQRNHLSPLLITISVQGGEEAAMRTFNPRLGITGGISIIGTSGIVKPFSSEAFISSIRKSMEVARATGSPRIVLNSGAKSERFIRNKYPELPPQAFVHYGNFIGETIRIANELHIDRVTLGVMIGKAVKLAEGHLDTHSKKVVMNTGFIQKLANEAGCSPTTVRSIENITLARELWTLIPPQELPAFCSHLIRLCHRHCAPLLPCGYLTVMLITEEGEIIG